jgi:20S proteasome alpha/beta subunit
MTIAIGALFDGGAVVCADTKICASDGATTSGTKTSLSITRTRRMYAIADACEDVYAAKMLRDKISDAISSAKTNIPIDGTIKKVMGPWYNSYRRVQPPQVQFLIAFTQIGWDGAALYYCEPPSTVASGGRIAIGKGSRAVDPLLNIFDTPRNEKIDAKSALVKLAYLMYVAKRDEGSACGGETHAFVVAKDGGFALVTQDEMEEAERIAEKFSNTMDEGLREMTNPTPDNFFNAIPSRLGSIADEYRNLSFQSLQLMEKNKLWKIGTVGKK